MTVELTYFKPSGKFYSSAREDVKPAALWKIWQHYHELADRRELPGLIKDHSTYLVLVEVPDHEHNHPHLIVPEGACKDD